MKKKIYIIVALVIFAFFCGLLYSRNTYVFAKRYEDGSIPNDQLEEWYTEVEKAKEQDAEYQAVWDKAKEEKGKVVTNNELSQEDEEIIKELREIASKFPEATFERAEEEIKGSIPKNLPRLSSSDVYGIVEKSKSAEEIISSINDVHKYPDFIYGIFGNIVYVLSDSAEDGDYAVWYGFDTKTESRNIKLIITQNYGSEIIRDVEVLYAN
mgnify:CR=1 FL=1